MKFAPASARGDAVAVSMVWLVANTTVKGRHDEDIQALRRRCARSTTPAPIASAAGSRRSGGAEAAAPRR